MNRKSEFEYPELEWLELSNQEKEILELRTKFSLRKIGKDYDLSPERIRQIHKTALKKLKIILIENNGMQCLPGRVQKILRKLGFRIIEEVISKTDLELLECRFIGSKTLKVIRKYNPGTMKEVKNKYMSFSKYLEK